MRLDFERFFFHERYDGLQSWSSTSHHCCASGYKGVICGIVGKLGCWVLLEEITALGCLRKARSLITQSWDCSQMGFCVSVAGNGAVVSNVVCGALHW